MPAKPSRPARGRSTPATSPSKVTVACPHCGQEQEESPSAYSTTCRSCQTHFRVQDVLNPPPKPPKSPPKSRQIVCFNCGTTLRVSLTAQSTMCKRCSSHVDLADYSINHSVSKNFRTKGTLIVEESGYLFNSDTTAARIVVKGRFIGKLFGEESLEIHAKAQIKGSFSAALLIIPPDTRLAWPEPILVRSADIAGELVGQLVCDDKVTLRSTSRMFGTITASHLAVESGAVFVGRARIQSAREDQTKD